jgi:hypothetical protein
MGMSARAMFSEDVRWMDGWMDGSGGGRSVYIYVLQTLACLNSIAEENETKQNKTKQNKTK